MRVIEDLLRNSPLWVRLATIFFVAVLVMAVFRDVRVPVDGTSYALSAEKMAGGEYEDAFRWSHALHVPVLALGYRMVGAIATVDMLSYYQVLDILFGGCGLCLLYLLVRRATRVEWASLSACVLVLFSWVFWVESVTADEKIMGFVVALIYLNLLESFLASKRGGGQFQSASYVVSLSLSLALALLLHASAVLLVPASVFLVVRERVYWLGAWVTVFTASIVLGAYALILNGLGVSGWNETVAYFSSGVSNYSVMATGVSGLAWIREVAQGVTKLLWALFIEDGLKFGAIIAGLNAVMLLGLVLTMWQSRTDRKLHGYSILFLTAVVFGMTYAPSAPDSYFLAVIPIAVFFARALINRRLATYWWAMLVLMVLNNGFHYLEYSSFKDNGAEKQYQEAINRRLSGGDTLVILDMEMGVIAGTQGIVPIHAYLGNDISHVLSSEFFSNPTAPQFVAAARRGRLFVEGLCFEDSDTRLARDSESTELYQSLATAYDLERIIEFTEYSSLYHRYYKSVYRVIWKE